MITGTLFDIQGFSVHDGPGCRTLIFFKGCPLHCQWCSNPEGIHPYPEAMYNSEKCLYDGACIEACPKQAIHLEKEKLFIDRSLCADCYSSSVLHKHSLPCSHGCLTDALRTAGYRMNVEELFRIISRDRDYWGSSGGITLTGGDPFYQADFAVAVLKRCYEAFIHTAVETSGHVPWSVFERVLPYLDLILLDLKHMDPVKHLEATGVSNQLILDNARKLASAFTGNIIYRIPLIPGFNDDEENMLQLKSFMAETGVTTVDLLPLHHLGREKYRLLGSEYRMDIDNLPVPGYKESLMQIYFNG